MSNCPNTLHKGCSSFRSWSRNLLLRSWYGLVRCGRECDLGCGYSRGGRRCTFRPGRHFRSNDSILVVQYVLFLFLFCQLFRMISLVFQSKFFFNFYQILREGKRQMKNHANGIDNIELTLASTACSSIGTIWADIFLLLSYLSDIFSCLILLLDT